MKICSLTIFIQSLGMFIYLDVNLGNGGITHLDEIFHLKFSSGNFHPATGESPWGMDEIFNLKFSSGNFQGIAMGY